MATKLLHLFSISLCAGLLAGCGSKPPARSNTGSVGTFKDDLTAFRPVYSTDDKPAAAPQSTDRQPDAKPTAKGKPVGDITARLNVALDSVAANNRNIRYAQGYRVQVYSGTSSSEANRVRDRSYALFPDITPHIVYIQPNFRVKVGDFIDRLEAQRVYVALRAEFPNALIIPERIEIR